jgi:hypothetical protein
MIEPSNDLDPTGADLIPDTTKDSIGSILASLGYLRESWSLRSHGDVNRALDDIISRLQVLGGDLSRLTETVTKLAQQMCGEELR